MGNSIMNAMKEQQEKNNLETKEQLDMLHKMMVNKLAGASGQMKDEALQDKSLPIVAVVDISEKYTVSVKNVPDPEITKSVKEILSGDFIAGLVSLLTVALNQFLGNTSAGETEKKDFHVIFANNSLLRVDYILYKYTFSSKGLKDEFQNGFCYYSQIGVLDLKKVNPQILLYELTRAIGEDNIEKVTSQLKQLSGFGKELYGVINDLAEAAEDPDKGSQEKEDDEEEEEMKSEESPDDQ